MLAPSRGLRGRAIECQTNSTTTATVAMATKYNTKSPITHLVYGISEILASNRGFLESSYPVM